MSYQIIILYQQRKMLFWQIVQSTMIVLVNCDSKIYDFLDLSDDLQVTFEAFEVVSRQEQKSDWCKDVTEVEEIRDVDGKHYRKMYLVDHELEPRILEDIESGAELYLSKRPLLNCFNQSDEHLIDFVKKMIIPEPDKSEEYNLTSTLEDFYKRLENDSIDLSLEMEEMFLVNDVKNGFFIEAGAASGEEDSHTLLLESKHNWTGLLVEPYVNGLLFKKRKAKIVRTCLALEPNPHYVELDSRIELGNNNSAMAGIVKNKTSTSISYQCIPLYSMLAAIGNPTVNWFILDIEGAEFQVLKTIPWEVVDIEMISVETHLAGLVWEGSREEIIKFMKFNGYIHRVHSSLSDFAEVRDDLFIREDVALRYGFNTDKKDEL